MSKRLLRERGRLKVLFAASEAYPLIKTGGLADVAAALPVALAARGMDARLILPAYPQVFDTAKDVTYVATLGETLGGHLVRVFSARMPGTGIPLYLVDCPTLYARPGGPYTDASGADWPDNHLRFAVLSHTAAVVAAGSAALPWRADILHANDWQTGLAPAYLRFAGAPNTRAVFTIHNMRYQGLFPESVLTELELPRIAFSMEGMEFHGQLSMLKAGLAFADRITTVSPTYAEEIKLAEFGYGMEGLLVARRRDLTGVLNGVDTQAWSPQTDTHIAAPYSAAELSGKARCKAALQRELSLAVDADAPLLTMVTRLTEQKGIDLVVAALPRLIEQGAQVAILGAGEPGWEEAMRTLSAPPGRVATRIGYSETLAHRFIAGGDLFLMPSRFEPCGLTQMYAMRYGTLPVVRRTGGLADTVSEVRIAADGAVTGTGFLFDAPEPDALFDAIRRGLELFADKPSWRLAQRLAMQQDFSWARAADDYDWIYRVLAPHGEVGSEKMRGEAA